MEIINILASRVIALAQSSLPSEKTKQKAAEVAKELFTCMAFGALGAGAIFFAWEDPIGFGCFGAVLSIGHYYFGDTCWKIFESIFGSAADKKGPEPQHGPSIFSFFTQKKPAFIPGQPPMLRNGGTTCFMNAAFQTVLNDPVLKRDLEISTSLWIERYKALDTLCKSLKNEERTLSIWKEGENSSHNLIPSVLALFGHDDFSDIKKNLLENLPDIKISFTSLVSSIQNKEPFDPSLLFQDKIQLQNTLDYFHTVKDLILETMKRNEKKNKALVELSKILKKCNEEDSSQYDICLDNLRPLLPAHHQRGQQDAVDFLEVLIHRIVESGIESHFLFDITHEKHYEEADINGDEKAIKIASVNNPSKLPPDGVSKETTKNFSFIIPIKTQDNPNGQELLDHLLTLQAPVEKSEPSCWIDNNAPNLYRIAKEKSTLENLPERFCISLSRGIGTQKNKAPVVMPETLTIDSKTYQMHSAGIHSGGARGGHYRSFVRKIKDGEATWWHCNDYYITQATADELKEALTQGSFYFFSEKTDQ